MSALEVSIAPSLGTRTGVLLNPHAGGGRAAALERPLRAWLQQYAPQVELWTCPDAVRARHKLLSIGQGWRVMVVGGDGSLDQLLPAILHAKHELALVPYGSGNDSARALGLYRAPWQRALAHALTGPVGLVDVGELRYANGAEDCRVPFLSSCTAGFDSSVGLRALLGPRWLRGMPRYLLATARELVHLRNWQVEVVADGTTAYLGRALFASVLNTPTFGSGMPAVPHARIDDGRLDLLVAGGFGRVSTLAMLPRLLVGRHLGHPRVHTQGFTSLRLTSTQPIPLATDGEYRGESCTAEVVVLAQALQVVRGPVPAPCS